MTTQIYEGGPAFPCDPFIASKPGHESVAKRLAEGMSLRDYLAAKAMQGMVSSSTYESGDWEQESIAEQAYQMADAMLRARSKGEQDAP